MGEAAITSRKSSYNEVTIIYAKEEKKNGTMGSGFKSRWKC